MHVRENELCDIATCSALKLFLFFQSAQACVCLRNYSDVDAEPATFLTYEHSFEMILVRTSEACPV